MKIKNQAYLAAGSVLLVLASQSNAALEEVVVTATKRAETIQDVPVSVTAVSADMMAKVGIPRLVLPALVMAAHGLD